MCFFTTTFSRSKRLRLVAHRSSAYLIIIIIDFYGAYILRNLSSEAQQNRISKRNRKQGRAKVSIRTRDNQTFMVGMQFGIDVLSFFRAGVGGGGQNSLIINFCSADILRNLIAEAQQTRIIKHYWGEGGRKWELGGRS